MLNFSIKLAVALLAVLAQQIVAEQLTLASPPDSKSIPDEIHLFLIRSKDCHHWAGEDGYDAQRRTEIEKAMTELKCSTLDSDKIILSKQFHQSPQIIDLIGSADTLSW